MSADEPVIPMGAILTAIISGDLGGMDPVHIARTAYLNGHIEVDELEHRIERALAAEQRLAQSC